LARSILPIVENSLICPSNAVDARRTFPSSRLRQTKRISGSIAIGSTNPSL